MLHFKIILRQSLDSFLFTSSMRACFKSLPVWWLIKLLHIVFSFTIDLVKFLLQLLLHFVFQVFFIILDNVDFMFATIRFLVSKLDDQFADPMKSEKVEYLVQCSFTTNKPNGKHKCRYNNKSYEYKQNEFEFLVL